LENRRNFDLWIDTCRWLAAVAVLFTHVNNRFLVKILSLPHEQRTLLHYIYALLSGFGHQAVVVFFVISGLLVGGSFLEESKQADKPRSILLRSYMLKRLVRLWTVLLPSLVMIALLDNAGIHFFRGVENGIYASDAFNATGVGVFFCNAAFLQTAACHQFGTDGALWSLYNEFWYYLLWPLVLFAFTPSLASWKRGLCVVIAVALLVSLTWLQFVGSSFAPYFAIWLLGVFAATRARTFIPGSLQSAILIFIAYLLTFRAIVPTTWMDRTDGAWFLADMTLALLFCNLLLAMKATNYLVAPPLGKLNTSLAGFSFSLYCTHTPIVMLYASILVYYFHTGWKMTPQGPETWAVVGSALCIAYAGAYGFSCMTEAHTYKIRRYVLSLYKERYLRSSPPSSNRP
jgi:peptidoglycan/LPS O-acetylase OafA/YrhL